MSGQGTLDLLWCPFPDAQSAHAAAAALVNGGEVACAHVLAPVTSYFRWQGAQEQATEVPLLCKIGEGQGDEVAARIRSLHPYDLPAIVWWPAACSSALAEWARHA